MEFYFNEKWEVPTEDILSAFDRLEEGSLILNQTESEYMQVLALDTGFTIELRIMMRGTPKQYRVGKNPVMHVWKYVNSRSCNISLKKSEVFTKDEAKSILEAYLQKKDLDKSFYKRNISKEISL